MFIVILITVLINLCYFSFRNSFLHYSTTIFVYKRLLLALKQEPKLNKKFKSTRREEFQEQNKCSSKDNRKHMFSTQLQLDNSPADVLTIKRGRYVTARKRLNEALCCT